MPRHTADTAAAACLRAAVDGDTARLLAVAGTCVQHPALLPGLLLRCARALRPLGTGLTRRDAVDACAAATGHITGLTTADEVPFDELRGYVVAALSWATDEFHVDTAVALLVAAAVENPPTSCYPLIASVSHALAGTSAAAGHASLDAVLDRLGHDPDAWAADDPVAQHATVVAEHAALAGVTTDARDDDPATGEAGRA